MTEDWKTYKLSDLGTIARGKSKHRPRDASHLYGGEYPFIQTGDVKGANHRINTHSQTYSESGLAQSKLWPKYTMCITIAANIAETTILNYPACFPDSIIGFIAYKEKCYIEFIEYMMQYFKKEVQSHSIGSVQDNINLGTFERVEFLVPPLPEQRAIASILSALDDKIELNLQMNKTLEEMALALYKHWFVDFGPFQNGEFEDSELGMIPEGWEVKRLDYLLEIKYGKDHKKLKEGQIPVYGTGGIMRYVNTSLYDQESILIPRKGSLNNLYYLNKPFWTVDTLFYSKMKKKGFGKYVFHFLKTLDLASMDVGSAIPSLTTQLLNRINIIIPPNIEVLKYDESATIWFNAIQSNVEENQTLTALRDTLLPKLISGEVRVKEVEKLVHESL